jgi:hypothetical protein
MFSNSSVEQITAQVVQLSFSERLRLIHWIIDTLPLPHETERRQYLVYGQFHGAQMSTEEDFCLAEWRPTEMELNGA